MHLVETMAYAGQKPWHGLGNWLAPQQPIEVWKQQAGMEHVEFTDQQVRAVTVWKVEADYFTAKVREKPQPHMH